MTDGDGDTTWTWVGGFDQGNIPDATQVVFSEEENAGREFYTLYFFATGSFRPIHGKIAYKWEGSNPLDFYTDVSLSATVAAGAATAIKEIYTDLTCPALLTLRSGGNSVQGSLSPLQSFYVVDTLQFSSGFFWATQNTVVADTVPELDPSAGTGALVLVGGILALLAEGRRAYRAA
ncbi:hypothetical protein [Candidatus Methylocalor cossyra]|uniref:hypothetical protein n=1 Tax=Candidatus Methylocalor cossyra TaxID=3108543 RepID=UPI0032B1EB08